MNNEIKDFDVKVLALNSGSLVLQLNSQVQGLYTISITDMSGRRVKTETIRLDAGSVTKSYQLPSGTYIWDVSNNKGEAILKKSVVR